MGLKFDIGVVMLADYDPDGHPVLQPDVFGEENSGSDPMEQHHAFGFWGFPHEPVIDPNGKLNPEKSSMLLYAWEGSYGHCVALEDTRCATKLPRLEKGGSVQYGGRRARPAFALFDGKTGSYTLYVPYAFSNDTDEATPSKACTIGINVRTPGEESVEIVHGDGMAITMFKGSVVVKNKTGNVYFEINDTQVVVNGNLKVNGSLEFGGSPVSYPVLLSGMVPSTMMKGI